MNRKLKQQIVLGLFGWAILNVLFTYLIGKQHPFFVVATLIFSMSIVFFGKRAWKRIKHERKKNEEDDS
ncbi:MULTISPECIES: hypothetical protein [unclassified Exiguobacterium]|uniref:hypothetical protein n=1 Tax=unclassified Exiguobacterium TaxID=2644629 RepID=UPI001BE9E5D8|nr:MULTISPECIES: hypothetical protein [unclassified Exiguobacterium]